MNNQCNMVSVIIPNYNHAPYLKMRIDSVLNQTYKDLEVIILDDCSSDNSREVIEQYKNNPKISHIIFNTSNSGSPFLQWQKGLALAKGEYVWIAESDDYADSNLLRTLLTCFEGNENVGIAYSDSNVVDSNNMIHTDFYKKHRNSIFKTDKWNNDYIKQGLSEIKENLIYECTINNMSAMVFKKKLLQYLDFDNLENFRYCGDWYFFISLLSHCDIAYKRDALNFFKYGTDNFKKGTKSALNYFKERFMVRYYFWKNLRPAFTPNEKEKLYEQLGMEMRIQVNEFIKGKINLSSIVQNFALLFKLNTSLFSVHVYYLVKGYLWKYKG